MPDVLSIQLGGGSVVQKNVSILSVGIIFLAKILKSNHLLCEQPYKTVFIGHFHTAGLGRYMSQTLTYVQRSANGSNNSQHCWANIIRSCCVSVGSGVQTMQQLPTMLGPVVHRGKDTTCKTLETGMCNARAWP